MTVRTALGAATLATAALAAGCAHSPRHAVTDPAADLRCEEAAEVVARRAQVRPLDELRLVVTAPASWALSGAGWVTDGAIVAGGGLGAGVVFCTPVMAIEGAVHGSGEASADCIASVAAAVWEGGPTPAIGRSVYRATRRWRCPDHVQLAREVRAVAACYAARDAPGDAELARLHLLQLQGAEEVWGCLPAAEQREVDAALEALGPGN